MTMRRRAAVGTLALLLATAMSMLPGPARAAVTGTLLSISTIPAIPGLPITLDGQTTTTDAQGVATFDVADAAALAGSRDLAARVTLQELETTMNGTPVRVVPARVVTWGGQPQVTLDVFWPVRLTFAEVDGRPVDLAKVGEVTIKNSIGEQKTISPGDTTWLQGSRVVPLLGHLEDKKVYWTVQDVPYEGSNVVNASQQRFMPADTQSFEVKLLFYSARIKAHDAFFGWETGSLVRLTYPDQHVTAYPFDEHNEVILPSLPRGNYTISISGPGPNMSRPVAISQDQDLDLQFFSWLDIAVAITALVGFVLATILLGRRRRRRYAADGGQHPTAEPHDYALVPAGVSIETANDGHPHPQPGVVVHHVPQPSIPSRTVSTTQPGSKGAHRASRIRLADRIADPFNRRRRLSAVPVGRFRSGATTHHRVQGSR